MQYLNYYYYYYFFFIKKIREILFLLLNLAYNLTLTAKMKNYEQPISYESQIQKLREDSSYYTERSLEYKLTQSEYEEIQTLPYEQLNIKPSEKYELKCSVPPEIILFKDKEENFVIQVLVETKFFIKRSIDDDTILSKPVPINLKNKNEKSLYKIAHKIQNNYRHAKNCLIL